MESLSHQPFSHCPLTSEVLCSDGLMVRALDSGLSGSHWSLNWGHCVVYSQSASLHLGTQMGTSKIICGSKLVISLQSRMGRDIPSHVTLQKLEISSTGLVDGPLGSNTDFTFRKLMRVGATPIVGSSYDSEHWITVITNTS